MYILEHSDSRFESICFVKKIGLSIHNHWVLYNNVFNAYDLYVILSIIIVNKHNKHTAR